MQLYKKLEEDGKCEDTRYYGVFLYGNKKQGQRRVKIDFKRYQKMRMALQPEFNSAQLSIINSRRTHYFYPAKAEYTDYNVNIFFTEIKNIKNDWHSTYKSLIQREKARIERPEKVIPADDYNFMVLRIMKNLQCGRP